MAYKRNVVSQRPPTPYPLSISHLPLLIERGCCMYFTKSPLLPLPLLFSRPPPLQHTHLLTAEECIMAADFQNQFPSPCKLSKSGYFGSKFVTVCVSGNENNMIDIKSYQVPAHSQPSHQHPMTLPPLVTLTQVSNQCQSLVRDDCLVPTLDAPDLGYIKESTSEQYVPDVFYKV